jgi:glycosyltransferase involved in cell wall biosynthesis
MKILQVNTTDTGGGAEKIAFNLFQEYLKQGHQSWLAVGIKRSLSNYVYPIPTLEPQKTLGRWMDSVYLENKRQKKGLSYYLLKSLYKGFGGWQSLVPLIGWEDFNFPGSLKLLSLPPEEPEIIHLHNLHGWYFDLRYLRSLSNQKPVVITMHDEWLYTGHCAYSFGCLRWMTGCGKCPDLSIYPSVKRDATAFNWKRKRQIYNKSELYIATPSKWLFDRLQESMLHAYKAKIINNGVDIHLYTPGSSSKARDALHLPQDAKIILVVANFLKQNPFKDYLTIERAIAQLGAETNSESIILVTLGGEKGQEMLGSIPVLHFPFERDENMIVKYYQAADIFIHSTHTDNFPTTILEAFACGKPVIATAIGGIPEQVRHGETGFLTLHAAPDSMSEAVSTLLKDEALRLAMGRAGREDVVRRFSLDRQTNDFLNWYGEILQDWEATHSA